MTRLAVPDNRNLTLRARCELHFESRGETPVVLMMRARPDGAQRVLKETLRIVPSSPVTSFTDVFGNVCDRVVGRTGEFSIESDVLAEVPARIPVDARAQRTPVAELPSSALHFTLPSRYCPSDRMLTLAKDVTQGCAPGYAEVQAIRDYVHRHLSYRYGVSDSSTDALDTLRLGAGVCRDFAHVAIGLCRSIDIPARMAVGYLHGREPMDMHAWFEAYVGGRWYTFDPTEDDLRGGRIVLAYGRDATDVAFVTDYGSLTLLRMNVTLAEGVSSAARQRLRAAG